MKLVLLGPPGSGKGTQGAILEKESKFVKLSTGDIMREFAKLETEFGKSIKSVLESGTLIDDKLITNIVLKKMEQYDINANIILDGYPRTIAQAEALDDHNIKIDHVLLFDVEEDELIKRISGRFSCKNCSESYNDFFKNTKLKNVCDICGSNEFVRRDDDKLDTVKHRLKVYSQLTEPLVDFYQKKGILIVIKANDDIDIIKNNIYKALFS